MADQSSSLHPTTTTTTTTTTTNPYEVLMIIHNSDDDTLTRNLPIPITDSIDDDQNCKDISLNTENNTWIRLYRPTTTTTTTKFPLMIYFHGGGFILCSAANTTFHDFCKSMATQLTSIVLSVEYRLAPENRLPAAYDDAVDAINWVQNQALDPINGEPWLRNYADFSKCFIMGSSAGGNIAYHACLRSLEFEPALNITGFLLHQPFLGGLERTGSELRLINDPIFPLTVADLMWELSLPIGADRDHVYCNLIEGIDGAINEGKIGLLKKCLVTGFEGDPLIDRQVEFVKMLEKKGLKVETWIQEGGFHGMEFMDTNKTEILFWKLKDFIFSN